MIEPDVYREEREQTCGGVQFLPPGQISDNMTAIGPVAPDSLSQIPALYHFTDRRNLVSIQQFGGLFPLGQLERRKVAVAAYCSDEASRATDRQRDLHNYVHLCFRDKHPMEHVAREQGRIGETIFIRVDVSVLRWPNVLFSPGMANTAGIEFYSIDQAKDMIDYEVLYSRTDWNDYVIQQRLQTAEKYEILVPTMIPLKFLGNLPNG